MYNCADLCVNFNKLCTDEILKEWDNYKFLKYDFFEDDFRWNYLEIYDPVKEGSNIPGKEPIILHYTLRRGTLGV